MKTHDCPICRIPMAEVKVRKTKNMPWDTALECPECGWFEVDALPVEPQEVPPRG